jgi:hypothetical protein
VTVGELSTRAPKPLRTLYSVYMTQMNKMTNKLPAGTYYVGDLCYVVPDDDWRKFCDRMFPDGYPVGGVKEMADGIKYADFCTKYGDGVFGDYYAGGAYMVDSGSIGCIPMCALHPDLSHDEVRDFGNIVSFDEAFEVGYDDVTGTITFGDIHIVTGEDDEEDYDCEEDDQ